MKVKTHSRREMSTDNDQPPQRPKRRESTPVSNISSEAEDSRSSMDKPESVTEDAPSRNSDVMRQLRRLHIENAGKFLQNWNPESSNRETRKLTRKVYKEGGRNKFQAYNDQGIYVKNDSDFCDCLEIDCPGCHFPCPKCASTKCGHDCRNNRKWTYDFVEIEGASDFIIRNQYK